MFHDFLGTKTAGSASKPAGSSMLYAEASVGASSGGGSGPISSSSDLGSDAQVGNRHKRARLYGFRIDNSGVDTSNRSNSDSVFVRHDSIESLRSTKILRDGTEWSRRSKNDEILFGAHSVKPLLALPVSQTPPGTRNPNTSKLMTAGPGAKYPPYRAQFVPSRNQLPSTMLKDAHAAQSIISQTAADEGSRTGIKGLGILNSNNASSIFAEKNPSKVLSGGSGSKPQNHFSELESSIPRRQMTIFYGGQAHVFDDVHPSKADLIMALAGSNGGSWSTICSPKSAMKTTVDNYLRAEESGGGNPSVPISGDLRGRLCVPGNTTRQGHGFNE